MISEIDYSDLVCWCRASSAPIDICDKVNNLLEDYELAVKFLKTCSEEFGFEDTEHGERILNWFKETRKSKYE